MKYTTVIQLLLVVCLVAYCSAQCHNFDDGTVGATKPTVTAIYGAGGLTINVVFDNDDANSTTRVFHTLDTTDVASKICRDTSHNIVSSAGSDWTSVDNGCTTTYSLTQTLSQVYTSESNNNWEVTLSAAGNQIINKLPIYATYSINNGQDCYTVSFPFVVEFVTSLQVSAETDTFSTIDREASFKLQAIYASNTEGFVVQGRISSENFQLSNIQFRRNSTDTQFVSSSATCASTSCDLKFTATLELVGRDASGLYRLSFDANENGVLAREDLFIFFSISYAIPETIVIDGETVTTSVSIYADNTFSSLRTLSFKSSTDTLFIENKVDSTSPQIPASYRLEMVEGYICCVALTSTISQYNATSGTGGCKDATGKIEHAQLSGPDVTVTPATSQNPLRYRLSAPLSGLFQSVDHSDTLKCEVLMISRLTTSSRALPKNIDDTYSSKVEFNFQTESALIGASSVNSVSYLCAAMVALLVLFI